MGVSTGPSWLRLGPSLPPLSPTAWQRLQPFWSKRSPPRATSPTSSPTSTRRAKAGVGDALGLHRLPHARGVVPHLGDQLVQGGAGRALIAQVRRPVGAGAVDGVAAAAALLLENVRTGVRVADQKGVPPGLRGAVVLDDQDDRSQQEQQRRCRSQAT